MSYEAAIMVRIDDMDRLTTVGSRAIRIPLTEVGRETVNEWVAAAMREAPGLDSAGELPGWSKS